MKRKTTLWLLFGALLSSIAVADGPVAARVNGEAISQFRLERYFVEYLEDQGRAVASIRNPKAYQQLRRAALDALIDKTLLWQEAQKRGVTVSDEQVQTQVEQTRQAIGGAEVFARRLEDAGFDEASFTDYTRRELAAQQVFAQLLPSTEPDEDQVRAFFDKHRAQMARPEQIQARHILLKVAQDADPATVDRIRLRLLDWRQKIIQGADFAQIAKDHSEDVSASVGGDLGYFGRGQMVPEFEMTAFALAPGETSQPVRTLYGWHLIYLENRLEAIDVPQEQGLETVRAYLARQQQVLARQQVLAQLRAQNRIERIDDE